jgi:hypothetical protein
MPTLRILHDGRPSYATAGQPDVAGVPSFSVGGGNTELVKIDFTAWLGTATLATSAWTVSGGTLGTETNSDGVATVLVTVPAVTVTAWPGDMACRPAVALAHSATSSDGRVLRQLLRLYPQPSSVA